MFSWDLGKGGPQTLAGDAAVLPEPSHSSGICKHVKAPKAGKWVEGALAEQEDARFHSHQWKVKNKHKTSETKTFPAVPHTGQPVSLGG